MSKEEIKRIFFELLTEDEEFKQRLTEFILSAVAEKFVERVAQNVEPPKSEEVAQEKYSPESIQKVTEHSGLDNLRGEKESLEKQLATARQKKETVEGKLANVQREKETVEGKLADVQREKETVEGKLADVQREKETVEGKLANVQREKETVEGKLADVQREKETVEGKLADVRREKESVEKQLATARQEKELAESQREELSRQLEILLKEKESAEKQLAERFAKGWDVYQSFLKLNAEARENSGFYAERFETFICKGAQYKSLDGIWEAALGCKRDGKIDDAEIFWDVFEYFVQLVNFAFGDNFIEILNTQTGERYNTDIHSTSGTNSSTQGVVREVILAGYKNNNNRKIVKKSNVRVG